MTTFPLFNSKSCDHQKNKEGEKSTSQHLLHDSEKPQPLARVTNVKKSQAVVVFAVISSASSGTFILCWSGFQARVLENAASPTPEKREQRNSVPLSPVGVGSDLQHGGPFSLQHLGGVGQVEEVKLHVDGSWRILPRLKRLGAIPQDHLLQGEGGRGEKGGKGHWVTEGKRVKKNEVEAKNKNKNQIYRRL